MNDFTLVHIAGISCQTYTYNPAGCITMSRTDFNALTVQMAAPVYQMSVLRETPEGPPRFKHSKYANNFEVISEFQPNPSADSILFVLQADIDGAATAYI